MKTQRKTSGTPEKLYKSKPVYFQTGLIVSLVVVYVALEAAFSVAAYKPSATASLNDDAITYETTPPRMEKEPGKTEKKTAKKRQVLLTVPLIDDDPAAPEPDKDFLAEPDPSPDLDPGDINYIEEDTPLVFDYEKVEFVPVFPGCENLSTNQERKACMSEKINALVRKHFKTGLAERGGLSGVQKIYTQFLIDIWGNVTEIKASSKHPFLAEEAERVIGLIPPMQPARQRDRAVKVVFTMPIVFKVQ